MFLDRLRAPAPGITRTLCVVAAAAGCAGWAQAQSPSPAAAAASSANLSPAERAKRDGDQVFHWILIHSDKPRKSGATSATPPVRDEKPTTTTARAKPLARAGAKPDDAALPATERLEAAPVVASAPPEVAASAPTSASTVVPAETADAVIQTAASTKVPDVAATAPMVASEPAASAVDDATIEALKPVSQVEPKFPINLVRTLRTGQVQVRFTVMPDGTVAEPTVLASSNARLNAAAVAAVSQWRFAPLRKPQQGLVDVGFNNAE